MTKLPTIFTSNNIFNSIVISVLVACQ